VSVIAVVGSPSAGVSSLAAALADRLPDHTVVEASLAPDAVVVVASAVAPLADSDVDLIERAAAGTDLVIGAVSKIDAHRGWRDVQSADRVLLARRDERYRQVPWVGVAIAVRGGIQRARLTLTYFVRRRCAEIGADLRAEAAELPRGGVARFGDGVRDAVADFGAELDVVMDEAIDRAIGEFALTPPRASAGPPPQLPLPRPSSRRLETRLMLVLGGGFGLGVALTLGRLTTALGPGSDLIGLVVGGAVGLLLTIWVVGIRGVLHDRALMDRWVGEVIATLRSGGEETIARRMLDAEIAFTVELRTHNSVVRTHNRWPRSTENHGKRRNSVSESFL
jgi:hypothetical protein